MAINLIYGLLTLIAMSGTLYMTFHLALYIIATLVLDSYTIILNSLEFLEGLALQGTIRT